MASTMQRVKLMLLQRQLRRAHWRAKLQLASLRASRNAVRRSRHPNPR